MIRPFPQLSAQPRFCGREKPGDLTSDHTENYYDSHLDPFDRLLGTLVRLVLFGQLAPRWRHGRHHHTRRRGQRRGYKPDEANLALASAQGLAISPRAKSIFPTPITISPEGQPGHRAHFPCGGNGARAYGGDGLPAPSAALNQPAGWPSIPLPICSSPTAATSSCDAWMRSAASSQRSPAAVSSLAR